LWLDKKYLIHVDDINHITGFSIGGKIVSTSFQLGAKRAEKKTEDNIYARYRID